MTEHTFTNWLKYEVHSARCALLRLYEEEARLKYMEGPRLEREYMDAVGHYEETVVREEMECELLATKQRLVQAALNRREAINEAEIDEKINELRQEMIDAASGAQAPQPYAELSPEQTGELQELYGKIVKQFHPSMHPEMTTVERQLYQKAQDAYRMRDLPTLHLIWEMLTASDSEGLQLAFEMTLSMGAGDNEEEVPEKDYSRDYSLASALYRSFVPLEEEAAITEEWKNYMEKTRMEKLYGKDQCNDGTNIENEAGVSVQRPGDAL